MIHVVLQLILFVLGWVVPSYSLFILYASGAIYLLYVAISWLVEGSAFQCSPWDRQFFEAHASAHPKLLFAWMYVLPVVLVLVPAALHLSRDTDGPGLLFGFTLTVGVAFALHVTSKLMQWWFPPKPYEQMSGPHNPTVADLAARVGAIELRMEVATEPRA